jgi:hypothetical protein
MRTQYLRLIAFVCDECGGPVVSGSTAVRENEISRETGIQEVGAICLSCGHRPNRGTAPGDVYGFPPVRWGTPKTTRVDHMVSAYFEMVNREELH